MGSEMTVDSSNPNLQNQGSAMSFESVETRREMGTDLFPFKKEAFRMEKLKGTSKPLTR